MSGEGKELRRRAMEALGSRRRGLIMAAVMVLLIGGFWLQGMFGERSPAQRPGATGGAELAVVSEETDLLVVVNVARLLASELNRRVEAYERRVREETEGSEGQSVEEESTVSGEGMSGRDGLWMDGLPDVGLRGVEGVAELLRTVDVISLALEVADADAGQGQVSAAAAWSGATVQLIDESGLDAEAFIEAASSVRVGSFPLRIEPWDVGEDMVSVGYRGRFSDQGTEYFMAMASDGAVAFVGSSEGRVRGSLERYMTGARHFGGELGEGVLHGASLRLGVRMPEGYDEVLEGIVQVLEAAAESSAARPEWMKWLPFMVGLSDGVVDVRLEDEVVVGLRIGYRTAIEAVGFGRFLRGFLSAGGGLRGLSAPPDLRIDGRQGDVYVRVRMDGDEVLKLLDVPVENGGREN